MRQGVTRPETPRDRTEREALVEDLKGNPLRGEATPMRLRNFRPDASAARCTRRPRGVDATPAGDRDRR